MKQQYLIAALAAIIMVQLAIPVWTIISEEANLKNGTTIYLRVHPVDPHDPFRGKYLNLRFDNTLLLDSLQELNHEVFLTFRTDSTGIDVIDRAYNNQPEGFCLRTTLVSVSENDSVRTAYFDMPFSRFYTNEKMTKHYEDILNSALADSTVTVSAEIKLGKGSGTLKGLLIDNTPITEYQLPDTLKNSNP